MNSFAWVVATVAYAISPQANTLRTSKKNVVALSAPVHDEDGNFVDTDDNPLKLDADGNPILTSGQSTVGYPTAYGYSATRTLTFDSVYDTSTFKLSDPRGWKVDSITGNQITDCINIGTFQAVRSADGRSRS